ncbi:hypothetical protein LTS18_007047, partial [Coniosporium uncinatum]
MEPLGSEHLGLHRISLSPPTEAQHLPDFAATWSPSKKPVLDPESLPIGKLHKGWERQAQEPNNKDARYKKVWKRYDVKSGQENECTEADDSENRDVQIRRKTSGTPKRAVKKLRVDAPVSAFALRDNTRSKSKATKWDRRKSALPRKAPSRLDVYRDTAKEQESVQQQHGTMSDIEGEVELQAGVQRVDDLLEPKDGSPEAITPDQDFPPTEDTRTLGEDSLTAPQLIASKCGLRSHEETHESLPTAGKEQTNLTLSTLMPRSLNNPTTLPATPEEFRTEADTETMDSKSSEVNASHIHSARKLKAEIGKLIEATPPLSATVDQGTVGAESGTANSAVAVQNDQLNECNTVLREASRLEEHGEEETAAASSNMTPHVKQAKRNPEESDEEALIKNKTASSPEMNFSEDSHFPKETLDEEHERSAHHNIQTGNTIKVATELDDEAANIASKHKLYMGTHNDVPVETQEPSEISNLERNVAPSTSNTMSRSDAVGGLDQNGEEAGINTQAAVDIMMAAPDVASEVPSIPPPVAQENTTSHF